MDFIGVDSVVPGGGNRPGPPPADADTGIIDIMDLIMFYIDILRIAHTDTYTTPIFIGGIGNQVVGDMKMRHQLSLILGIIRQVGLKVRSPKKTRLDTRPANILEQIPFYRRVMDAGDQIQTRGRHVFKPTALDSDMAGILYRHPRRLTSDPRLVFQPFFIR